MDLTWLGGDELIWPKSQLTGMVLIHLAFCYQGKSCQKQRKKINQ